MGQLINMKCKERKSKETSQISAQTDGLQELAHLCRALKEDMPDTLQASVKNSDNFKNKLTKAKHRLTRKHGSPGSYRHKKYTLPYRLLSHRHDELLMRKTAGRVRDERMQSLQ